jgi:hypothetical protein
VLKSSQTSRGEFERIYEDFMDGMFAWETKYFDRKIDNFHNDSEPGLDDEMREKLLSLFNKYVINEGINYDRVENLVCRTPSDYDRNGDDVEINHVSAEKILVLISKRKGMKTNFRLTFIKKDDAFMLSRRDFKSSGRWCRTHV